jgi:mono/diheme cytochrome c family protein
MSVSRVTVALAPRSGMLTLVLALAVLATCAGTAGAQESNGLWVAPERAGRQTDPTPPTANNIKHGRSLFQRECELCHGKAGHGDGMQAAYLTIKPADLASDRIQSQSDGAIFYKITEGRGQMPKAKLNDTEKWAVIEYLRTLATKK